MLNHFTLYAKRLATLLSERQWDDVEQLACDILKVWRQNRQVFLCGNGGSAANAVHIANDLLYGVGSDGLPGIRVEALAANTAVITCLANDISYDEIFSQQLSVKANEGDLLVVLSGSGNSLNVVRALEIGKDIGMLTYAIVGYSGGRCRELAENSIHLSINDMQLSEDFQLIVGHMCMQWLKKCDKASSSEA